MSHELSMQKGKSKGSWQNFDTTALVAADFTLQTRFANCMPSLSVPGKSRHGMFFVAVQVRSCEKNTWNT